MLSEGAKGMSGAAASSDRPAGGPARGRGAPVAYLDNAATTRPLPEAVEAVQEAMESRYGNPSARHGMGLDAAGDVDRARETLARMIGARPGEIVFTGGGSEANNLALKGVAWAYARAGRHVIVSAVEHPSILEAAAWLEKGLGFDVTRLPVDREGFVDPEDVGRSLTDETVLVSLMHVNNEVGAVEPVEEIGRLLRSARAPRGRRKGLPLFHVDAVQSLGRLPVDVDALGIDLLSVSAHKVHGPKGVGALYVRSGVRLVPLVHGGGHEGGRRSGTENVPGIAGFGAALARMAELGPEETVRRLADLRRRLAELVRAGYPDVVVNGPLESDRDRSAGGARPGGEESSELAAPHILSLSFPGLPAEVLQHHLEERGVYVSTGSACSSHHRDRPSHVLTAMGCPPEVTASAVRLSLSPLTTPEEIELAGKLVGGAAVELSRTLSGGGGRS